MLAPNLAQTPSVIITGEDDKDGRGQVAGAPDGVQGLSQVLLSLAKARAALRWCGYTNQHAVQHGGKRWHYLLVPDTAIQLGYSIKMLCAELTLYGKIVMSEPPKVPKAMQEKFTAIIGLAEPFCVQHLDQHYRKLIAEATAALCRKWFGTAARCQQGASLRFCACLQTPDSICQANG